MSIANLEGRTIAAGEFKQSVSSFVNLFRDQPESDYALYTDDAYPFAMLFMALLHAGKTVWLPGNNRPGTAQHLREHGCRLIGDWGEPFEPRQNNEQAIVNLYRLDPLAKKIVIFTSGSTGEPKAIRKNLQQLQREIDALESLWGNLLGDAEILATVSHQHIYGLLFRVLWPLSAGRCFHSPIYLNPEILVNHIHGNACWVASPAHLKRLAEDSPWQDISRLTNIFSSGGALTGEARRQIFEHTKQQVVEIFGSSETGGIGWRQDGGDWTLFKGLSLTARDGGFLLTSPYLPETASHLLDDSITQIGNGRFELHGRTDRIVKVEEKRLSLTEMETRLQSLSWVNEAATILVAKQREVIAAVIALAEDDLQNLPQTRQGLIKQARASLQAWFEPVVLPRKWLFVNRLPLTAQGKIDLNLLTALLTLDECRFPQPSSLEFTDNCWRIGIKVSPNLVYFPDHFANFPILPGVVQLAWVEYFGKLCFGVNPLSNRFSQLEKIKFIRVIRPGDRLTLQIEWQDDVGALSFNFSANSGVCSSGRMLYRTNQGALTL